MIDIQWRPYQVSCKQAVKKNYDQNITRQLIVAATGVGKRMMAVDLMQHFNRSLFIAHREELIIQAYNEINTYFPMHVGIVKGPAFEIDKRIVVGSVQTLKNRLDKMNPDWFQLVIIDESHHYMADTYLKVARHWKPKLLTGWTATPKRLDGLSLSNIFEKIVYQYDIRSGILDGYLSTIEAYQITTSTDISGVKKTAGDFNQRQLSEVVDSESRNNLIVKKYRQYSDGRQTIAYCVDMDHAYNLRNAFRKEGIYAEAVVSDSERCPNRTELVSKFRAGDIPVITNVEILTEGFDYADIGSIIMARPTHSETLYIQCIGRGTRLKSEAFKQRHGTDKCIVLDFVDNTGRLTLVNSYELEKNIPVAERLFLPKEHKEKLLEQEKERRERLVRLYAGKDRKIDLLRLPEVRVWDSEKMLEPATEKQLDWLRREGIYQDGVEYTKKQASEIISNLPCGEYQMRFLAMQGYDVSRGATQGQYQRVKQAYEIKNKFIMNKS